MTDIPIAGRSRTPSAQLVALLVLSTGSFGLVAAIIAIVAFKTPAEPVRLMLAGFAGSLITIPLTIAGFYFGASLKQAPTPAPGA